MFERILRLSKNVDYVKSASLLSLVIAALSLYVAAESLNVSQAVREDARVVAGVDLRPKLLLRTELSGLTAANGELPPSFVLANVGPIPAIQTTVQFVGHVFNESSQTIDFSFSGLRGSEFLVGTIEPLETEGFVLSDEFLHVLREWGWGESATSSDQIIEARISYRKEPDKRLFIDRAFYFVNPEGKWVSEIDGSLTLPKYSTMKESLIRNYRHEIGPGFEDPLHTVTFEE